MANPEKKCSCGNEKQHGACAGCRSEEIFPFWCEFCERSVSEKRCPFCGLKARRKRQADSG